MKHFGMNFKKLLIVTIFSCSGLTIFSQTSEQSRSFINRTHIAVAKVEKEMYKNGNNTNGADLKKAIKYQMIAVKLQAEGKFKQALGYSFKSREECIAICSTMSISEGSWYALNDDEKAYCNPNDFTNMTMNVSLLGTKDNAKVDALDVLDIQKFHELTLNVK